MIHVGPAVLATNGSSTLSLSLIGSIAYLQLVLTHANECRAGRLP